MINNIKKVIGSFWFQLWRASWLVNNIVTLLQKMLWHRVYILQQNMIAQLSIKNTKITSIQQPRRVLLLVQEQPKKDKLKLNQVSGKMLDSSLSFQTANSRTRLVIPIVQGSYVGSQIRNFVYPKQNDWNTVMYAKSDYTVNQNNVIINNLQCSPSNMNYKRVLGGDASKLLDCYQTWSVTDDKLDILDSYCTILGFPKDWVYRFPQVVSTAFKCRLFGVTVYDALFMLGTITQYPICAQSGIVSQISTDEHTVTIGQKTYTSVGKAIIDQGQYIEKGSSLFIDKAGKVCPKLITKISDQTSADIPSLQFISSVGPVTLVNSQLQIINKDILPIANAQYIAACSRANSDYNIPYISLQKGKVINPLKFVVNQLLRDHFATIITTQHNIKQQQLLFKFILQNIPKSTALFIIPQYAISDIAQLDLHKQAQKIQYYKNNNLYTLEVSDAHF